MNKTSIGRDEIRIDSWNKVTGRAKYTSDFLSKELLHARILTSDCSHAYIKSIDFSEAENINGVQKIITGEYLPVLTGSVISDRPPIAKDKVRYYGEPLAVVIADNEHSANQAVNLIKVEYEPLPILNSTEKALENNGVLVHENLGNYYYPDTTVYPQANTNIADHIKIRKGNMDLGWKQSDIIINSEIYLPSSDHLSMETRNCQVEILPNGIVNIYTSSQGPFAVKEELSKAYGIPEGNIVVHTPLVGGAFGGKATVQLEFIGYLASFAVGGKKVKLSYTREEDIKSSPSKLSANGKIKIGATNEGIIKALEAIFYVDCGAYADTGPRMAKSIAIDCSGPYNIENIHCDSYSIYTNHGYTTSFRGFGHAVSTFAIERAIEKLSKEINMDPIEIRIKNSIIEGNTSPTQELLTYSNSGDIKKCLNKLREIIDWKQGNLRKTDKGTIIAKGVSAFWKTANSPTNAGSGAIIILNSDGSLNLNIGAVEIGPGMKTTAAQILAEKMKVDISRIHVFMDVNTRLSPKHWKTVASMTSFMVGNALIKAADDLILQLKELAAIGLKVCPSDLEIGNEKVYLKHRPETFLKFKDLAMGYKYENGNSIYGQLIGRGSYILSGLTPLDKETGKGNPGNSWTVGAQAVEIEYNPKHYSYRLLRAATVIDAGRVINPKMARGIIMGGMSMGLGLATREELVYDADAILMNTSLRTYKLLRFGENPEYLVEFVETPQLDGPFGARGIAEHGILGIPPAFANAISLAAEAEFDTLPVSNETIWEMKTGGKL